MPELVKMGRARNGSGLLYEAFIVVVMHFKAVIASVDKINLGVKRFENSPKNHQSN